MTDKEWQITINSAREKFWEYQELLKKAEDEYIRQYGNHPSDIGDDNWIDLMHYGRGSGYISLSDIREQAELYSKLGK